MPTQSRRISARPDEVQPDIQLSSKWRASAAPVLDSSAHAHERADEKESMQQIRIFEAAKPSAAMLEAVVAALRATYEACSRTGHSADSPAVRQCCRLSALRRR